MERPNDGPAAGQADQRPVLWPEMQGTITFTLPAGASDAQLEQLAELVRRRIVTQVQDRRQPAIRVTDKPGATEADLVRLAAGSAQLLEERHQVHVHTMAAPRRPGDGRLAATPGLWPSGLMGQQAGAYTWGADPPRARTARWRRWWTAAPARPRRTARRTRPGRISWPRPSA